jgi:hypothetical protein
VSHRHSSIDRGRLADRPQGCRDMDTTLSAAEEYVQVGQCPKQGGQDYESFAQLARQVSVAKLRQTPPSFGQALLGSSQR